METQNRTPQSIVKNGIPSVDLKTFQKKQVKKKVEPKPLTESEIYNLKKDEQISMLNKLGVAEIPHYEKDRVALILKLQ